MCMFQSGVGALLVLWFVLLASYFNADWIPLGSSLEQGPSWTAGLKRAASSLVGPSLDNN